LRKYRHIKGGDFVRKASFARCGLGIFFVTHAVNVSYICKKDLLDLVSLSSFMGRVKLYLFYGSVLLCENEADRKTLAK
jgi:hypothetical protein